MEAQPSKRVDLRTIRPSICLIPWVVVALISS